MTHWVRNTWFDSGYMLRCSTLGFWTNFRILYVDVDSEPEVFLLRSHAEWRSMLSRCFWLLHFTRVHIRNSYELRVAGTLHDDE